MRKSKQHLFEVLLTCTREDIHFVITPKQNIIGGTTAKAIYITRGVRAIDCVAYMYTNMVDVISHHGKTKDMPRRKLVFDTDFCVISTGINMQTAIPQKFIYCVTIKSSRFLVMKNTAKRCAIPIVTKRLEKIRKRGL